VTNYVIVEKDSGVMFDYCSCGVVCVLALVFGVEVVVFNIIGCSGSVAVFVFWLWYCDVFPYVT